MTSSLSTGKPIFSIQFMFLRIKKICVTEVFIILSKAENEINLDKSLYLLTCFRMFYLMVIIVWLIGNNLSRLLVSGSHLFEKNMNCCLFVCIPTNYNA